MNDFAKPGVVNFGCGHHIVTKPRSYEFLCFHFDLCIAQMTFGRSVIEKLRKLEDFHDTSKVTFKFGKSRLDRAELLLLRFHIVRLYYMIYILQCITAKLISIDPFRKYSVQPLCLCRCLYKQPLLNSELAYFSNMCDFREADVNTSLYSMSTPTCRRVRWP